MLLRLLHLVQLLLLLLPLLHLLVPLLDARLRLQLLLLGLGLPVLHLQAERSGSATCTGEKAPKVLTELGKVSMRMVLGTPLLQRKCSFVLGADSMPGSEGLKSA